MTVCRTEISPSFRWSRIWNSTHLELYLFMSVSMVLWCEGWLILDPGKKMIYKWAKSLEWSMKIDKVGEWTINWTGKSWERETTGYLLISQRDNCSISSVSLLHSVGWLIDGRRHALDHMTRRSDNAVGRFGHPIHGTLNILCGEILGEQQPRMLLIAPSFVCNWAGFH